MSKKRHTYSEQFLAEGPSMGKELMIPCESEFVKQLLSAFASLLCSGFWVNQLIFTKQGSVYGFAILINLLCSCIIHLDHHTTKLRLLKEVLISGLSNRNPWCDSLVGTLSIFIYS